MPDANLARSLYKEAKQSYEAIGSRRPTQAKLRRIVSTAYYAVFHGIACGCANALIGSVKSERSNKAWVEVYRALDHGTAKKACSQVPNRNFPSDIIDIADAFQRLQEARHASDYNPMVRISKVEALTFIDLALRAVEALDRLPSKDMAAFAAFVLLSGKGSTDARSRAAGATVRKI